jgi:hypothetical protein
VTSRAVDFAARAVVFATRRSRKIEQSFGTLTVRALYDTGRADFLEKT